MASTIKVDKIEGSTGSTITVPTGQTLTVTDGIPVASGGTGLASFTAGDILYATGATTLVKLAKGTGRQGLQTNSGATAPEWTDSPQSLMTAAGDVLYASGANTLAKLAKGSDDEVLTLASGVPSWAASAAGGKVGQCTQFVQQATQSVTSYQAFTNAIPNFAHSMTPSATDSKILVNFDFIWGDDNWVQFALYSKVTSGGTYAVVTDAIASATGGGVRLAGTVGNAYAMGHNNTQQQMSFSFLDSPATTSEMFYTLYVCSESNHAVFLNRSYTDGNYATVGRQISTITLTEILA